MDASSARGWLDRRRAGDEAGARRTESMPHSRWIIRSSVPRDSWCSPISRAPRCWIRRPDWCGSGHRARRLSDICGRDPVLNNTAGGRKGWRVPSIFELSTLIDPTVTVYPLLPGGSSVQERAEAWLLFWSSTRDSNTPNPLQWARNTFDGAVNQYFLTTRACASGACERRRPTSLQ